LLQGDKALAKVLKKLQSIALECTDRDIYKNELRGLLPCSVVAAVRLDYIVLKDYKVNIDKA